jgi:rod shape-determining protein MreD
MRGYLTLIIISIAYLVVESTLVTSLPLPDVLLLLVFYTAVTRPTTAGVVFCFFLGYLEDIFLGGVLGSTSFSYMAVFLAVYFLSKKVHFQSPGVAALTALALASVKVFLIYVIMQNINSEIGLSYLTLADIVLSAVFAPFVMNILERIETIVSPHAFER